MDMDNVRYVGKVDPDMIWGGHSSDVNDYLAMDGWVYLAPGVHIGTGDNGS